MTGFYIKHNTGLKWVKALHSNLKIAGVTPIGYMVGPWAQPQYDPVDDLLDQVA